MSGVGLKCGRSKWGEFKVRGPKVRVSKCRNPKCGGPRCGGPEHGSRVVKVRRGTITLCASSVGALCSAKVPSKSCQKKVMSKLSQKLFFSKMFPCSLDYAFFQRDYTLSLFSALGSVSEVYVSMVRDLRLPRLMYLRSTPFSKGLHNFLKLSCHDKPLSRETSSYTDIGIMS